MQAGVPKGRIEGPLVFKSKVFAGTIRHYWVYVPAQYDAATPASVMVFQDGDGYVDQRAEFRVPVVFDNLIHKKEMPVTIGIFINPGHCGETYPENQWRGNNRSFEYDTLSDQYARFLIDEILPEVGKKYNLTKDPGPAGHLRRQLRRHLRLHRRLGAARRVPQGAEPHRQLHQHPRRPRLSRADPQERAEADPRLPAGRHNDLDNQHGNWPLANQEMAAALKFAGYDYRFDFGDGAHTASTAARSCPTRCAGCGGPSRPPSRRRNARWAPIRRCRPACPGRVTQYAWTSKIYPGTTATTGCTCRTVRRGQSRLRHGVPGR